MLKQPLQLKHFLIGLAVLFLTFQFQTCSTKNAIATQAKKNTALVDEIVSKYDSLMQVNTGKIVLKMEQEGYKISSRMLYDQNTIVRTDIRPDDKMAEYAKEIEKLQKQIDKK